MGLPYRALDKHFKQHGLFYNRYMDDISILTKTRRQNRRAVRQMNQLFNQLKVSRGFDFLRYHFSNNKLRLTAPY